GERARVPARARGRAEARGAAAPRGVGPCGGGGDARDPGEAVLEPALPRHGGPPLVPPREGGERVKPRRLSDDALADALVVRAAGDAPATPCPSETRIWEAFQGRLAPAEVASLLDHAASCADCSLAMRVAQAMGSEAMPA